MNRSPPKNCLDLSAVAKALKIYDASGAYKIAKHAIQVVIRYTDVCILTRITRQYSRQRPPWRNRYPKML